MAKECPVCGYRGLCVIILTLLFYETKMNNSNIGFDKWNDAVDCLEKESITECLTEKTSQLKSAKANFESALPFFQKKTDIQAFQNQFMYILDKNIELFFQKIQCDLIFDERLYFDFNQNFLQEFEKILELHFCPNAPELQADLFYNLGLGYYKLIDVFKETDYETLMSLANLAKNFFEQAACHYVREEHVQACKKLSACTDFDMANLLLIDLEVNKNHQLFQKFFEHFMIALDFYLTNKDWCNVEDIHALIDFTGAFFNQYPPKKLAQQRYEFNQQLLKMEYVIELPRLAEKPYSFFQSGLSLCNLEKKYEDIQIPDVPIYTFSFDNASRFCSKI